MLYFAYGSNLDDENWIDWCRAKGYDPASIEPIGPAWLPDHEPVFHYRSRLRKGGALDVRARRGAATPGALFRVHDWAGLDAKEGVSGAYYRRIQVVALTADGRAHEATTYRVCEDRIGGFVAPGAAYQAMVTRGLSRFGHSSDQFEAVAAGQRAAASPTVLFTYGTLMRGEQRHDLIAPRLVRTWRPATVSGASLLRIDWYPGLVLAEGSEVSGELVEVDDVSSAFEELDPYEDFGGYDQSDSLYRRSLVSVRTNSRATLAWTYVFTGDTRGLQTIASGRWPGA